MNKRELKVTDNPKIEEKKLSDGNISLYLNYYLGQVYDKETGKKKVQRRRECLHITLFANPKTPLEKDSNKKNLILAKQIRYQREMEFRNGTLDYSLGASEINLYSYLDEISDKTKDRIKRFAIAKFKQFLSEEYPIYVDKLTPKAITKELMEHFATYLLNGSKEGTVKAYWVRIKTIFNQAVEKGLLHKNPCNEVKVKVDTKSIKKAILSLGEIKKLINTNYEGLDQEVRKAFIFTLYTGVRFCDICSLTYGNVDTELKQLSFSQNKTRGHSVKSFVNIPLNKNLMNLIGNTEGHDMDEPLFKLPQKKYKCRFILRDWCEAAGINKHITWHCGRHSFATNVLSAGADIRTVSNLMGHTSLEMTERYLSIVDENKKKAIDSLPTFDL